jgi:predicted HAD superfamily Cof-like phosphohydrolase
MSLPLDLIDRVFSFNERVVGIQPALPGLLPLQLDPSSRAWLTRAFLEEINEFLGATSVEDEVDAIIDLVIFAVGGLCRMGLTREQAVGAFLAVVDANDCKAAGVKAERAVDGVLDAVKPAGWVDPKTVIKELLK